MKSIGYSFIEPSTFEIVNLRNTYSDGHCLIVNDRKLDNTIYWALYGKPRLWMEDFAFSGRWISRGI